MAANRKRAAFIVGISLALISVAEFSLRAVWGLGSPALVVRETACGYRFRPDQHLRRFGRHIDYNSGAYALNPSGDLRPTVYAFCAWATQ
jgi:hypothetical protein